MEQAVLKALTHAMGSQSDLQLAATLSAQNVSQNASVVNNDLNTQAGHIRSTTAQAANINKAQSWASMVMGFAAVLSLGVGAAASLTIGEGAMLGLQSGAGILGGASSAVEGGLQMANGIVQSKTQDALAQAGLDGATTTILGSVTKTMTSSAKNGATANALIAQKTTEAIQAYGRAQQQR